MGEKTKHKRYSKEFKVDVIQQSYLRYNMLEIKYRSFHPPLPSSKGDTPQKVFILNSH